MRLGFDDILQWPAKDFMGLETGLQNRQNICNMHFSEKKIMKYNLKKTPLPEIR